MTTRNVKPPQELNTKKSNAVVGVSEEEFTIKLIDSESAVKTALLNSERAESPSQRNSKDVLASKGGHLNIVDSPVNTEINQHGNRLLQNKNMSVNRLSTINI